MREREEGGGEEEEQEKGEGGRERSAGDLDENNSTSDPNR